MTFQEYLPTAKLPHDLQCSISLLNLKTSMVNFLILSPSLSLPPHLFSSHPLLQIFSLPQWVQTTNIPSHSTHIFLFKSWSSFWGNYLFLFFFPPSAPPFFSWSTIIKKYSFGGDTFMVTPLEKAV